MGCHESKAFKKVSSPTTRQHARYRQPVGKAKPKKLDEVVSTESRFLSSIRRSVFTSDMFNPLLHQPKDITAQQTEVIRTSWAAFISGPDPVKNVMYAFIRMFVLAPETISSFKFVKSVDPSQDPTQLLQNVVMREHVTHVMQFLDESVRILGDPDSIKKISYDLGKRHYAYGARPIEFAKALCEGFLFTLEKMSWPNVNSNMLQAWEDHLLIIIHHMSVGFQTTRDERSGREGHSAVEADDSNVTSRPECEQGASSSST